MKAVKFKYQNITFAKDQPEYTQLPARKLDTPSGEVITCWRFSLWERLQVLFFGRVWLSMLSFNKPLTPCFMAVGRKSVFSHPDDLVVWYKRLFLYIKGKLS
jgi:hypothetical protein